jgi:hypothetical protein
MGTLERGSLRTSDVSRDARSLGSRPHHNVHGRTNVQPSVFDERAEEAQSAGDGDEVEEAEEDEVVR